MGDGVIVAERVAVSPRTTRAGRFAWVLAGAAVLAWLAVLWQVAHPSPARTPIGWGIWTLTFGATAAFAVLLVVVGAVIATRHPGHPIAWFNVAAGVALTLAAGGLALGSQQLAGHDGLVQLIAFVSAAALQASFALFALVPLWFPDGPSSAGRFRVIGLLIPIAFLARFGELFFQPGYDWLWPAYPSPTAPGNPFAATGLLATLLDVDRGFVGWWLSGTCLVLAGVAVTLRFLRSSGAQRHQLLWFVAAIVVITPSTIALIYAFQALPPATSDVDAAMALFISSLALPTLATLIAITRYRLYEIDRIVNRALVYGAVTAILAGLFAGLITVTQKVFDSLVGASSDAAIAATAVLVTAAYVPVRGRVERTVDRHVRLGDPQFGPYREALGQVLDSFDPRRAVARLVRETTAQMRASAGRAYLELDGDLRLAASVGEWTGDPAIAIPIGLGENRIGELHLGARPHDRPYSPRDVETLTAVADLAARAIIAAERASVPATVDRLTVGRTVGPP